MFVRVFEVKYLGNQGSSVTMGSLKESGQGLSNGDVISKSNISETKRDTDLVSIDDL